MPDHLQKVNTTHQKAWKVMKDDEQNKYELDQAIAPISLLNSDLLASRPLKVLLPSSIAPWLGASELQIIKSTLVTIIGAKYTLLSISSYCSPLNRCQLYLLKKMKSTKMAQNLGLIHYKVDLITCKWSRKYRLQGILVAKATDKVILLEM